MTTSRRLQSVSPAAGCRCVNLRPSIMTEYALSQKVDLDGINHFRLYIIKIHLVDLQSFA